MKGDLSQGYDNLNFLQQDYFLDKIGTAVFNFLFLRLIFWRSAPDNKGRGLSGKYRCIKALLISLGGFLSLGVGSRVNLTLDFLLYQGLNGGHFVGRTQVAIP